MVALLSMLGISKRFPGVQALEDVSIELYPGEVFALVGENGAGKSTLMKILGGIHQPDKGHIYINGNKVIIPNVHSAKALGIAMIHQELMLAANLDVAGNIFLGEEHHRLGPFAMLNRRSMNNAAEALLAKVGLDIPAATPLRQLTTGQMQMVEIAKALSVNANIIVMDEPTSSLTAAESERLFKIINNLRKSGIAVIYISHKIEEVLQIADRITVLRDGKKVAAVTADDTDHEQLVSMMIGREFSMWFPKREHRIGDIVLEVNSLVVSGTKKQVSFNARKGEILGFAGLVGSGRTELMQTICGVDRVPPGYIKFQGSDYSPHSPAEAIEKGVYLVPEDRKLHGLVQRMSVAQNISLPDIANYKPKWLLQRKKECHVARRQCKRLDIKTPGIHQKVVNLSGGNQQKVVLGKWLAMKPKLLILDEPTRGIDVGAKAEIYRRIAELAAAGITILMVSSEMEEIIGMSDRVVVMYERQITGVLAGKDISEENIAMLMTGKEKSE